jgi:hypothetical protein
MRAGHAGRPAAALLAATVLLIASPAGPGIALAQDGRAALSEGVSEDLPAPGSAFIYSLATTAAPVVAGAAIGEEAGLGLIGAGLLFGPLSGYAYGDVMERGGRGLGFRAAVAGGTVAGILLMCQLGECNPFSDANEDQDLATGALLVGLVGSAVVGGSALIDVLSVPDHVARRNTERRAEGGGETREAALSVAPYVTRSGDVGLAANVRF